MRRGHATAPGLAAGLSMALGLALPAQACPLAAPVLQRGAVQAQWQVEAGAAIQVAKPFAITLRLCPEDATLLLVDATMPEHRHGMNYRSSLSRLPDGRWRAQGLMLHMPGRWQLQLDVLAGGEKLQLTDNIVLP